ncbi:glycosyltransferase [Nocardioides dongkuii]|uniref:glycosyltransferase n=1 Tax=Nocardioides dongkuii TaxID=2760089 RepID=UPI001FD40BF9|nr:glycosyltransferase [Nocardioides dongkuii]
MSSESVVTIGLPVRHELASFRVAVRSVFAQSYQDWRLIIVCDGSSAEVVDAAQQISDARVSVVADGESRGLSARLNEITRAATTELVARMDADDVMHSERLALQIAAFRSDPHLDLLATRAYLIDEYDEIHGTYREPPIPTGIAGYLQNGVFTHPTVMFRRTWGVAYPYNEEWLRTEDKEVWFRAAPTSKFSRLETPLLYYRVPKRLSIQKQSRTASYDRKFHRAHARAAGASVSSRSVYLGKSLVKQGIFAAGVTVGWGPRILASKASPLSQDERRRAERELAVVSNVGVPGW